MPYFTQKSKIKVAKSIVLSFIFFARVPSLRIKFHQLTNKQICLLLLETLNEKARPKLPRYIWGSKFYAKNILISCYEQKA